MNSRPYAGHLKWLIATSCLIALAFSAGCSSDLPVPPTNTVELLSTATPLSPTPASSPNQPWITIPILESKPSPTPTPTIMPRPTMLPNIPVEVKFVAVELEKRLPSGTPAARLPWHRSMIEVYHPTQSSPMFFLSADEISYQTPLFSPNGRWMAYVEEIQDPTSDQYGGKARLRLASTGWDTDRSLTDWYEIFRSSAWLWPHSWSPDSQWLAFRHANKFKFDRMYIVNIETGEMQLVGEPVRHMAWSNHDPADLAYSFSLEAPPDKAGLYLTTVGAPEQVQKVALDDLAKETYVTSMVWNPAGTQLAFCTYTYTQGGTSNTGTERTGLWLVDVDTLSGRRVYSDTLQCGGFAWSSDGQWLASSEDGWGWGVYGAIFYQTTKNWTLARQPARGEGFALSGQWMGNLFLYTEITNLEGNPGTGRNLFYQLVATSPEGIEKAVLWHPQDVGLLKRIRDSYSFRGLSWYAITKQ